MLNRTILAVITLAAVASTNAFARFPDSYTDLDPRVRAAEQASFSNAVSGEQREQAPGKFDQIDRASPL